MPEPTPPAPLDPARLALLLDAAVVVVGISAVSIGVGLFSPRAGLVAFGALLLGAELAGAIVRRAR